jgi:hypothetical protein
MTGKEDDEDDEDDLEDDLDDDLDDFDKEQTFSIVNAWCEEGCEEDVEEVKEVDGEKSEEPIYLLRSAEQV